MLKFFSCLKSGLLKYNLYTVFSSIPPIFRNCVQLLNCWPCESCSVGVFTPWKWASTIHQGFQLPALLPLHSKKFDLKMQLIHFSLFMNSSVNFGKCREFVYPPRSKYRMRIITLQILLFPCSWSFSHYLVHANHWSVPCSSSVAFPRMSCKWNYVSSFI